MAWPDEALVPFVFQGARGTEYPSQPEIAGGGEVGKAWADVVGATGFAANIIVVLLFVTVMVAVMTAMAGSSRTLFQGGQDGWLPKYLAHLNNHKVPTFAMWTDLGFNLILLLMKDYLFVLAVSHCNYMIFNFLNLNAGWIHRIDNPKAPRPYRPPTVLLALGTAFACVNAFMLGAGANVWRLGYTANGMDYGPHFAAVLLPSPLRDG